MTTPASPNTITFGVRPGVSYGHRPASIVEVERIVHRNALGIVIGMQQRVQTIRQIPRVRVGARDRGDFVADHAPYLRERMEQWPDHPFRLVVDNSDFAQRNIGRELYEQIDRSTNCAVVKAEIFLSEMPAAWNVTGSFPPLRLDIGRRNLEAELRAAIEREELEAVGAANDDFAHLITWLDESTPRDRYTADAKEMLQALSVAMGLATLSPPLPTTGEAQ